MVKTRKCERCGKEFIKYRWTPNRFCGRNCAAAYRADKKKKPRATCPICAKSAPIPGQPHCSRACAYRARKLRTRKPKYCLVCNREFFQDGKVGIKYCSLKCYNVVRSGQAFEVIKCAQCGKEKRRRKVRTRPMRFSFCSHKCFSDFTVGTNHPQWRGTNDNGRGRGWKKLSEQIRERDGYQCQRCGKSQADSKYRLSVDHIRPWRSFTNKEEANDPSNLVSLCQSCHTKKTLVAERQWLKGDVLDVLALLAYEKSVK